MSSQSPFTVMVKPVGSRCNLRCSYCYYLDTKYEERSTPYKRMDHAVLEQFICQYIQASPDPVVRFTWHGGEPTLAGIEFYRRVLELQRTYLRPGQNCWNNLQTNGILLDDEWCSFLAQNHFDVGISIDGTKWLHDAQRKDAGGLPTYDRVTAAVHNLQAHGIQPDLLCTVSSLTAQEPLAVYRSLRALHTGWIQFIPIVNRTSSGSVRPESVGGKQYGEFLTRIFQEWIYHDLGTLDVQLFAETAQVLAGGSAGLCWMAPTCGRVPVVEYDGSVFVCDHFVQTDYKTGNIQTQFLEELVNTPQQIQFGNAKRDTLSRKCLQCPWRIICQGGCPKDRFIKSQPDDYAQNYLCEGLYRFFSFATPLIARSIQLGRQGLTAEKIMATLRIERRTKWKTVGRNDPCPCGSGQKAKNCCWELRI